MYSILIPFTMSSRLISVLVFYAHIFEHLFVVCTFCHSFSRPDRRLIAHHRTVQNNIEQRNEYVFNISSLNSVAYGGAVSHLRTFFKLFLLIICAVLSIVIIYILRAKNFIKLLRFSGASHCAAPQRSGKNEHIEEYIASVMNIYVMIAELEFV